MKHPSVFRIVRSGSLAAAIATLLTAHAAATTTISPGATLSISSDAELDTAPATATPGSLVIDATGTLATTSSFTLNANRGIAIGASSGIGAGIINVASATVLTYGGIITSNGSGTGGLTKAGTGTLVLAGSNTYTGDTTISAGTLRLGSGSVIPSGLGKGDVAVTGTLDLFGNSASINGLSGAGTVNSSVTGAVTLTAGGNNRTSTFSGVIQNNSGTLAFTKTGTGTLTLGGNNTFTGGVTLSGGVLQLANAGALNSSNPNSLTFGPSAAVGTKLQLNGNSISVSSLATDVVPGSVIVENTNATAATLTVNQAGTTTFAGVLQNGTGAGALSLTKSGAGSLTLSGTNSHTGITTISAGTLVLASGSAIADTGAVVLSNTSSATLLLSASETIGSLAGGGASGGNVSLQGYTLTTGGANTDTTYSGVMSGSGSLVKVGTGTFTLAGSNNYTGATTIKSGSSILGVPNALPSATMLTLGDGTTNASGSLKLNGFSQTLAGLTTAGAGTGNSIVNGGATAVTLTVNTLSNNSYGGVLGGAGLNENNFSLVKTGAGTLTLSGTNTFTGTTAISQGTLSAGNLTSALGGNAAAVILGDATNTGTLAYTGSSTSFTRGLTVNAGGGEIDTTTAGQTLTLGTGNVAASGAFTVGGTGNTSITSNITGTGTLNKSGTGTLTLSGSNTYSGATNIRNGTLILAVNDTGLKSTTTLTLGDATLNTNGVFKLDGHTQTLAGLAVAGSGTGNRAVGGSATLSTLTLITSGTNTFAGILGGTGTNENNLALVKTGTGTLTLAGTNTFTGGTTVSAGTLSITLDNNLGGTSSGVILNGGTLSANASITLGSSRSILLGPASGSGSGTLDVTTGNTLTYGGVLANNGSGSGNLIKASPGTLILAGSSSYGGTTTITDGTLALGITNALPTGTSLTLGASTTGGILKLSGKNQELAGLAAFGGGTNRIVNGNLTASTLTLNIAGTSAYSAYLGGTGTNDNNFNLTKTGGGTLTLSGANTYAGITTVSAGTLKIGSAVTIPSGTGKGNLVLDGTLDLNTYGITVNGLSGAGTVTTSAASTVTLTVGSNDQSGTFSGVIQNGTGTLALTKTGTGSLTLSGANTYGGTTTIYTGGTLKIGNAAALPSGTGKGNVSLGGSLDLNGNSITLNGLSGNGGISSSAGGILTLSLGANDQSSSYGGAITNGAATSLALTKIGTGTLTLASVGTNTYTGGTTITAGTLLLGNDRTLPSAGSVFVGASGKLDINGRTGANAAMGSLTGTGIVTNSAANTGTITLGNGDVSNTFNGTLQDGTAPLALVKTGLGTLTLTPASNNAFSGGITINGGVLQVGNANALNSAGTNVVSFGSGTGAKLQLNGNSITIAGLSTTSNPVLENASTSAVRLTINNSSNYSYSGVIQDGSGSAALSLTKSGAGTQTLTGTNSYTGGTIIGGGILAINKDTALGATAGQLTIGGGKLEVTANITGINSSSRNIALTNAAATIVVDSGFTYTEAGVISGSGTLNKEGKGILQISGTTNTYSGGTVISAGLLDVTATSGTPLGSQNPADTNNNITVNAGGNLSLSSTSNKGSNQSITVTSSSSALGGIGFSNTGLSQANLSGMFTDSSGGYGGVLSINNGINYSGAITLAGNWYLGSAASGSYSGTLTISSGTTYRLGGGGGTLSITGTNLLTGSNDVLVGSNLTNGNGAVVVNSAQNYIGKTTVTGGASLSIGGDASLGTAPGTVTPGSVVLDNGTLQARANNTTLSSNRGIAVGPASGSGTGTLDTNGYSVSYGGIIANNGAGTGGFTKMGTGTLTLTGVNTFTGPLNINGGTINFTALANLGAGTAINISGGTLQYASGNITDITTRTVTLGSNGGMIDTNGNNVTFANAMAGTGSFSKNGTGTLTLNAVNAMGNITVNAGTLKLGVAGATPANSNLILNSTAIFDINGWDTTVANLSSSSANAMVINSTSGASKTLTVSSNTNTTYAGVLADNAGSGGTIALNKTGNSTLTLSGSNTYSGGTSISAGTLSISSDTNLGASLGSATPGNIVITGGATLAIRANLTIDANRGIAIGPSGSTAATLSTAAGTTVTYNGVIANSGTATGGLTKSSSGTLVLGGANTYAGDTTISGGTLKIANPSAIPAGSGKGNVSVSATLDLNGNAITVNGLSGSGTLTSSVAGSAGISIGGNDQSSTFSGAINNGSGTVSVAKSGTGSLTLSGTSSYTGGTTISGGVLSISTDANLGTAPGTPTVGNLVINGGTFATSASMTLNSNRGIVVGPASGNGSGSLTVGTGTTLTYGGIIANNGGGTGSLTKTSTSGTLVLSGANTYSGDTTIAGGTLQLGNVAAIPSGTGKGDLTLTSGSTLDLNNLSPTVNGLSGSGTITNSLAGTVTITVGGSGASGNFTGVIQNGNGTVCLAKVGAGTLILGGLNTYSGDTTVSNGTLQLGAAAAIPSGSGKGSLALNGTLDIAGYSTTVNGLTGSGIVTNSLAGVATLTAGASDQTSTFAGNIQNGAGSVALTKIGTGTLTLSGTNTYSGATTITSGTLAMGSTTGLSPNSTVTISGPAGFLDVNGFNVAMDGLLGTGTITNNGATDATLTAGASGGSSTFSGVIADGSKALSLTKSGAGTLTLNGVNTYSGITTIANGTISAAIPGSGGNLGTGSSAIVLGDTTTKGTLSYSSNADLSYSRGFTVNAGGGGMDITSTGKTLTLQSGGVDTTGTFTLGGAGNVVVNSVISGSGGFTKANTGTLLVNSANTYAGDTTISSGVLQLGNVAALPSGSGKGNMMLNATLDVNNLSITVNGLYGAGVLTNSAGSPVTLTAGSNDAEGNFTGVLQDGTGTTSLTKIGNGTLILGGVNTYSGTTTVTGGTLQIGSAYAIASGPSKGIVTLGSGGTLDLHDFDLTLNGLSGSGTVTNNLGTSVLTAGANDQPATFTGNIQDGGGTIGLTKAGAGSLTLSGSNTFSGATTIAGGTLSMGSNTALSSSSTLTVNNAGTLDLNGKVIAIDGLDGTGSIINNSATPVTLTTGTSGGGGIFGGTINDGAGVIALVKTGVGTVTLSNVNTYSGGTTVTGGLLAITSTGALGAIPATPTPGNIVLNGGGISATNTFEISANRGIAVGPASGSGSGILDAAQNQTLTYNGIIANRGAGSGGLTKTGLGTLTLGGINTYSGDTSVNAGAMQIANANAIPSGPNKGNLALADGAMLDLNSTSITVNGLSGSGIVSNTKTGAVTFSAGANNQTSTFSGQIEDGNGITSFNKVGTGVLTLAGTNTYTGGTTITDGKLSVAVSGALGLESNALTIGTGATLQATGSFNTSRSTILNGTDGTIEVAAGKTLEYTSSSVISGSGSLIKTGAGTLSLGGVDTYTGGTYIKAGTLVSTSGQAPGPQPPAGSNLYAHHIYDGATLQITVGSWSTERQIELMGDTPSTTDAATIDITNGYTQQRNGLIYGAGKLNLVGTGTMIVTNANTYSGGTIVEHGLLQVNNSTGSATGTGAVTVQNGGTLSGLPDAHGSYASVTGAIVGTVEIKNTGELAARSGGTLTLGGLTLDGGSLSTFQLGAVTATPVINITGSNAFALPASGLGTIDITNTGAMAAGTYHLFDYTGTAFTNISNLALANPHAGLFNLSLTNNTGNTSIDLDVTAIAQQWQKSANTNWSQNSWWTESPYAVPNAPGAEALFMNNNYLKENDPVFASAETVTLDINVTVGSIAFNNANTAFTIHAPGAQTLTLDETGGAAVIQIISAPNTAGANNVIDAPVILAHDLNIGIATGTYGLDISGAISGDGKTLTKTGAGPLTLSGSTANTYGGLTEVTAGTLKLNKTAGVNAIGSGGVQIDFDSTVMLLASNQIADDANVTVNGTLAMGTSSETIATLAGGGAVTTGSGSVLTIAGAVDSTFSGVISGGGGIAKTGAGTLTLNGTNTYTGGTAINGGVVRVGADNNLGGAGGIAFGGGTLFFSGSFESARDITLNSGGGTLDTDGSAVTLTGLISGAGTLTKQGLGTVTLNRANDYTGTTVIENGILRISNASALGTAAGGTTVMTGGELELYGAGLTVNEPLTLAGGEVCTLLGTSTYNGAITLTADSGIDADSDKLIITSAIGQNGGAFGLTKSGPGIVELAGINTYTGVTHVEEGTLSLSNGAAIADTGAVILANTPGVQLSLNASETIGSLSGGGSGGGNVELGGNTLTLGDANNTRFDGIISGLTSVAVGVLNIQSATALGTTDGSTTVASAAALQLQGNITVGNEALTLNGTGIDDTGVLRNISGNNTYGGLLTLGSATRVNSDAGSLTLSNPGTITGNFDLTVGGAGDSSIGSIIGTGSGILTKDGSGTLTLGGANTYAGNTIVSDGTLRMANTQAIPSGTGKGNLFLAASATLDLNNTGITVNGLSGTGLVTNNQTGNASLTIGGNDQISTFNGVIIDGNGLTALAKVGTGTLTLTGINNYSGGTTIAEGTLRVSADANLGRAADTPTAGTLVLQAGATLAATESFTLDSNRGIAVGPAGAGIIDVADTKTLSYGGTVADNGGSGGLTKTGTGTLVLSGASFHTGTTTVVAGVLTVNGTIADSASVVVQSSATLTGTGTTGALTVQASGSVAPGNSGIGALGVAGNLSLSGNARFDLGTAGAGHASPGTSDRIDVIGGVSLGGNLYLTNNGNTNNQGSAGAGSYKIISYTGEASGSFSSVSAPAAYHAAVHDVVADKAIYLDMYNYAAATVTPAVDIGRIHAGSSVSQTLTVANAAASGDFTESLGAVFGTPDTGLTTTGSVTGLAGQAHDAGSMSVGFSNITAGSRSGSVSVIFTSQAIGGSGLPNTTLAPQTVTVSGFAYTGQGEWIHASDGSWGNNVNAYGNWSAAGGVPGLDGSLSAGDSATFGSGITAASTVSLDGANPTLSGMTFNSAKEYTLAQGGGGVLTLKGNGGAANITVDNGSHGISAPLSLESNANITVSNASDTLAISGPLSGNSYGITKTGAGTLALTGPNTYGGATNVNAGLLLIDGDQSGATGAVSVAPDATLGGIGVVGGAATIESGGRHAPGGIGTPGTQTFATGITYNSGSIFEWELFASASESVTSEPGNYDKVVTPSAVAGSANSEAIFHVVLGTNHFSDVFWDTNRSWTDVFSGGGSYDLASLFPAFGGTDGVQTVAANGVVAGEGHFYYAGSSLNWSSFSTVPEPTGALVGGLLGAGWLSRRRRMDKYRA